MQRKHIENAPTWNARFQGFCQRKVLTLWMRRGMARLNELYMPSSVRQQRKSRQVLCSVNYHASWNCRFLSTSLNRSGSIDGLGLGIESLALRCLTIHSAEAFDAQLLPGLCHCGGPSGDVLVGFLAGSMLLLGHNLVTLVLQQVCLFETCCSLLFAAPEDHGLCRLSSSNLAHCLLLHHSSFHRGGLFHCLHALHHGLLHGRAMLTQTRGDRRDRRRYKLQESWSPKIKKLDRSISIYIMIHHARLFHILFTTCCTTCCTMLHHMPHIHVSSDELPLSKQDESDLWVYKFPLKNNYADLYVSSCLNWQEFLWKTSWRLHSRTCCWNDKVIGKIEYKSCKGNT